MSERDIFTAARHIPALVERNAFLEKSCAGDAGLRERVEELLRADDEAGSFLQLPDGGPDTVVTDEGHVRTPVECSGRTQFDVRGITLDFLSPSDVSGSLGRFGPYEISDVVGFGGMGIVLKGRDAKLNRVVAVKVMAPELAGNATARWRFMREAQAAAAVAHPHIVTIYAVDEDRLPYLVMEFVDGMSLQEKIDREGHLETREILRIGTQIASGLAAAHAHGVIHRDIKPANIMLENGVERVRITDFGLARAADDVGLTNTGDVAGTPQYMSPEQAQGQTVDSRTDLFSLGSVLYAMCAGRSPFRADTTMGALRRVCDDRQRPIREINPDVPDWLVAIIDRLLEKNPDGRFQTAGEVAELLARHLAHVQDPESAPFPGANRSARRNGAFDRRGRWLMAKLALVAFVTGFVAMEATGVTRFSRTVIRVVTGEGGRGDGVTREPPESQPAVTVTSDPTSPVAAVNAPPPAIAPFDAAQAAAHQEAWSEHLGVPVEFTNSIGMTFRLIPPGEFTMGTPREFAQQLVVTADHFVADHERTSILNEGVPHPVRLTQPFYVGEYEVTRAHFRQFVEATGFRTDVERNGRGGWSTFQGSWMQRPEHVWSTPGEWEFSDDEPACLLSWDDAQAFCDWLSQAEGRSYVLPTDAQWEFACRAGTTAATYAATGETCGDIAWTSESVGGQDPATNRPQPVGSKRPNAFGVFDMLGNVWEPCSDWYAPGPQDNELRIDPTGPTDGDEHVLRGGAWYRSGRYFARAGVRQLTNSSGVIDAGTGFRVAIVGDLSDPGLLNSMTGNSATPDGFSSGGWVWTAPVNLGADVNSVDSDSCPFVAADGLTLIFSSDRPGGQGQSDLWLCARPSIDDPWIAPVNLGESVNTASMETDSFLSADGLTLLVASDRPGGHGHWDIWILRRGTPTAEWSHAINPGPPINGPWGDGGAFLTSDGLILLFHSNRPGGEGGDDIWISRRSSLTANWLEPVPLGPSVNTDYEEWSPCLSSDGRTLLFGSDRPGGAGWMDIWMSRGASPFGPWTSPINLGPPINLSGNDASPSLSANDDRLYFESGRSGNLGAHDLWMTTRVPKIDYVRRASASLEHGLLDEAAGDFAEALDLASELSVYGPDRQQIGRQVVRSDEVFDRVVALRPQDIFLWSFRGDHLAAEGRWQEATECYQQRLDFGPDGGGLWSLYAIALLAADDSDAYRHLCEEMFVAFADVSDPQEAWFVAWATAIAPDSVKDRQRALRIAELAMNGLPDAFYGARACAAWLYRLGRFEESIACWNGAGQQDWEEIRICFLAMAHHRLGNTEQALQYAAEARANRDEWSTIEPWDRRVTVERLLREMEAVFDAESYADPSMDD